MRSVETIWLNGRYVVSLNVLEVWISRILDQRMFIYWRNGYGVFLVNQTLYDIR